VLVEVTGGDDDLAAAVLRDFVEASAADLMRLDEALAVDDRDEARRQGHRLKGASAVVGARLVAAALASVSEEPASST
jgi:HPt (histidine-containing phosphotransfer) domain-containing protein